jgi:pantoate--beta-alanine ligase
MIIFKTAADLSVHLQTTKQNGKSIGFVPTMGALHPGHLSLIQRSKQTTDLSVCSIFVNPTQFNNPDDFKHYPVTIEKDIELLVKINCDILFLPAVNEIYPAGHQQKNYELGSIETILEGAYRPGHFQGVCEVVNRLLEIVAPDHLFMGQKDYQQCIVIAQLLSILEKEKEIELHIEPTLREMDGLAMSSRNLRLSPENREKAVAVWRSLAAIKAVYPGPSIQSITSQTTNELNNAGFRVDYVEIRSAEDLEPITSNQQKAVALIAAGIGPVRLIDNLLLN